MTSYAAAVDSQAAHRSRRPDFIARVAVVILGAVSLAGGRELFNPNADGSTAAVAIATFIVSWIGILATVRLPNTFGISKVTPGGAFIAAMNVILLAGLPTVYRVHHHQIPQTSTEFIIAVLASYLLVIATVLFLSTRAGNSQQTEYRIIIRVNPIGPLMALSVLVVGVYFVVAWPPAIIAALEGSRQAVLAAARNSSFASLEPAMLRYLFGFVRTIALPLLSAYFVAQARRKPTQRRWVTAAFVVAIAFVAAVVDVQKAPSARLMLVVLLAYILSGRSKGKIDAFSTLVIVAMVGAPLLIARWANSAETSVLSNVSGLLRRMTELPAEVVFQYFRWVDLNGHLNGAGMPYVPFGLTRGPVALSREIYQFAFATYTGQAGSANGAYIGFFWVDFGWFGIIIGSILVGVVLFGLDRFLLAVGPTSLGIALRALIFVQVAQLPSTSLWSALLSFPFGMVDLLIFLWLFSIRVRSRPIQRSGTSATGKRVDPPRAATLVHRVRS